MIDGRWEVPNSWAWTKIDAIGSIVGGGTPASKVSENFESNGIPWITPSDLTGYSSPYISRGRRDLSKLGYASCGATLLPRGTVLFSSRAPIGYCAIAANEVSTSQGFKSIILEGGILPEFLRYYLLSAKEYAESEASGTTFLELSGKRLGELLVPIAPINEQKRIVEKLNGLFESISRVRTHLEHVPSLVESYRAAVLDMACSGRLTAGWRVAEGLSEPRRVRLGDVARDFSYGTSAKSSVEGAVPVLRMGNIQRGSLDWTDLVYTSDLREIKKYNLRAGDVLFNRTNSPELVGKTAVYKGGREAVFAGYLIRVRCGQDLLPDYLGYCLNAPDGRRYSWEVKSDGVSQSNINAKKLADFSFWLPTLAEQAEIVRRVESAFSLLENVSSEHAAAEKKLPELAQGILSKAFAGKLISQDAGDEVAHIILSRILSERKNVSEKPKRKKMKAEIMKVDPKDVLLLDSDSWPKEGLPFPEVAKRIQLSYDAIREALFALLSGREPVFHQVFDESRECILIQRINR